MKKFFEILDERCELCKQKISIPQITVKEAGYMFVYLSYETASSNWVYFDDFKVTQTKTNVLQYNEYYAYGLQTANSWTRENTTANNFLGNGGTELNTTTSLYDLEYRNYDPILGRMNQVDPMASKYASLTPYNYSFNSPTNFNDPLGDDPPQRNTPLPTDAYFDHGVGFGAFSGGGRIGPGSGNHWSDQYRSMGDNFMLMSRNNFQNYYGVNLNNNDDRNRVAGALGVAPNSKQIDDFFGALGVRATTIDSYNGQAYVTYTTPAIYSTQRGLLKMTESFVTSFDVQPDSWDKFWSGFTTQGGSNDLIERLNRYNDFGSAYADIPGLAFAITTKELYQDAGRAYKYYGALKGLERANTTFKFAGVATGVASVAFAGYLAVDKYDKGTFNTSTVVDLGISSLLVVGGIAAGTVSAPFVIAGGLIYGVARIAAGDQIDAWIDKKFDTKSFWYGK